MEKDEERMRKGGQPLATSDNTVKDVPDNFKEWIEDNEDKIKSARSTPYFITDNKKVVENILSTPKTLRKLSDTIDKYEATGLYGSVAKMHKKEIERAMSNLFEQNDFGMLIRPDSINAVMHSYFKNQFETGTSGGVLYSTSSTGKIDVRDRYGRLNHRLYKSHLSFGISDTDDKSLEQKQLKRREYEKYGLLLNRDKFADNIVTKNSISPSAGYGSIEIRFKKDRVQATWTPEDSLGSRCQPSLISDPKSSSWDNLSQLNDYFIKHKRMPDNFESFFNEGLIDRYIELQYHGDLTVDCIESILFPYRPNTPTDMETIRIAKSKGILVYCRLDGMLSLL